MLSRLGALLFCLGLVSADSEWMIIPIGLIVAGIVLYRAGERRGE